MIIFGGRGAESDLNDLWMATVTDDEVVWEEVVLAKGSKVPAARHGHSMVLLRELNLIVVQGMLFTDRIRRYRRL
jgi:hypothetical protein